jgi:hypothetical protein
LRLFRSCVKNAWKTRVLRVGPLRLLTKIQIVAQPFGIRGMCGYRDAGVP